MSNARSQAVGTSKLKMFLAFLSGTAAVALVGGSLVVAGVSAQKANAAPPPPPGVSVATPSSYIWGEDLPITITFTGSQSAGPQYNLSAGILLPADVTVVSHGLLGAPVATYTSDDGALPGVIVEGSDNGDNALICADLGLEPHPTETSSCAVPDGMQYLVYQNISDLPVGAVAEHTITVRPNAANYGIGTDLNYQVNAYTSNAPRYIPVFPGSTGVGHDAEVGSNDPAQLATSNPGRTTGSAEVNALRITKAEISHPENEVLRGVHGSNGAVYELTIDHTGQADLNDAQVVDYLPAGLEYLGSCGIDDNTSTANGTPGSEEHTEAGELNTEAVDDHCLEETSVETVAGSFNEAGVFIEDEDGEVYTRVTWNLADNRWKVVNSENSTANGVAQPTDLSEAGNPATTVIRYRAGVPLFENTLDFGGTMPDAGSRQQGANLDNNRGASTRHGTHLTGVSQPGAHRGPDGRDDNAGAIPYSNVAIASGSYDDEPVSDRDSETITAVDVRIVKTMNDGEPGAVGSFEQGNLVKYTLSLATSEYVAATIPNPDKRPLRIVDDMANGLCPVFPQGTNIWGGESSPEFFLGAYNAETETAPSRVSAEVWNTALVNAGVDSECAWNTTTGASDGAGEVAEEEAEGLSDDGALISIAFSPTEGRFFLEFALNDEDSLNAANSNVAIEYFVHQNSAYIKGTEGGANDHGATTSRDLFSNESEINLRTTPIVAVTEPSVFPPGIDNDERERLNADWNAWDDSRAFAQAGETVLTKHVLERGVVPEAAYIWQEHNTAQASSSANGPDPARWVDSATQPFAVGDETWYRIVIDPPDGADVRNPVFTDFLPEGVSFDATIDPDTDRPENLVIVPTGWQERFPTFGTCTSFTGSEEEQLTKWRDIYAPMAYDTGAETEPLITLDENVLTFKLGARGDDCGVGSTDRFLPFDASLEIYLKVTVTNPSAFAKVDLPQNLAKYQQSNMEEEIFFLRDDAAIESDRVAKLVKGVETVTDNDDGANSQREARSQNAEGSVGQDGKNFNSNRDGIEVVQGEEVTYRLDVTAPYNDTTGYLIWDVLPEGIKAADVDLSSAKGYLVTDGTPAETALSGVTVHVYDVSPSEITLKPGFENRSVIVWGITDTIPASTKAIPAVLDTNGGVIEPAVEAVERGLTLKYTVTVPEGVVADGGNAAQITQEYDNVASIVEFSTMNNGGGTTKMVINGPSSVATDRTVGANEYEYQDTAGDLTDDSGIYLPGVEVEKTLVSSQVGANGVLTDDRASNNAQNQIVQGELVTFNYEVTIPANTTVKNAQLFDRDTWSQFTAATGGTSVGGPVEYDFMSADYFYNGSSFTDRCDDSDDMKFGNFVCHDNYPSEGVVGHGVLVFPESYTNNSGSAETFGVQIKMWIEDDLTHNHWLENVAQFDFDDPNNTGQRITETASERVQYIEPQPSIAKQAVSADGENLPVENPIVKPASEVTYELVVTNANDRPALFNGVVYDCVPAELTVNKESFDTENGIAEVVTDHRCAISAGPSGSLVLDADGQPLDDMSHTGTLIQWTLTSEVRQGSPATLRYTATVDPEAGGSQVMRNAAHLRGYTIPSNIDDESTLPSERRDDREARANEDISLTSASVTKTVDTPQAPIGDTVEYTITATFPANANYYDVTLVDTLPAGVEYVATTSRVVDWQGATMAPTVEELPTIAGSVLTWELEGGDFSGSPGIDFGTYDEDRTITITYTARITDDVTQDNLVNEVELTWNAVNDTPSSEGSDDDTATVMVVHPAPTIDKKVQGEDLLFKGNPDAELTYTIEVGNTAGRPDAHDVQVIDTIPQGVLVDELTISPGGGLAGQNPQTGGGTITWTNLGPIVGGESIQLSYTAKFVDAEYLDTTVKTNTAKVDRYYSWNDEDPVERREYTDGPSDTAQVQPIVPAIELAKAVTNGDIAYAEKPFGWTITATNTGEGDAQELSISDTLPENWNYDTDTSRAPQISADGGNTWQSLESPSQSGSLASGITLSWNKAQIREALGLTGETAPVLAGATGDPYQAVQIRFSSVPTISARDDAAGHTAVDSEGTRVPVPHINTVTAIAEDTRGDEGLGDDPTERRYSQDEPTANAYIHAADLTISKERGSDDPIKAGTTREGAWKITVTNNGPDTATGPITVSDTTAALPAGVRITDISGEGWTCAHPSRTDQGVTTFTCDRTEPDDSLDAGASFEPIYADVAVSSNQPAVTGLSNTAEVHPGNTFDPNEENNTDTSSIETTTEADLQIVKTFTPAGKVHNAGDTISWNLVVKNNGPSDSVSSADNPITVTDEVPSHITDVAQLAGWSVPGGWNLTIAGNNITLTMDDGLSLVDQGEVTFSFQGVVDPSTPQGTVITNIGEVAPGDTPDPNDENNKYPDSTTPTVKKTTVQATKERVVADGAGGWTAVPAGTNVVAGEPVHYRLAITNTGQAEATNLTMTDVLPSYLSVDDPLVFEGADWSLATPGDDGALVFNNPGPLAPGATSSLVVTLHVDDSHSEALVNAVCVDADEADKESCVTDSTGTDKRVDWEIAKTHVPPASGTTFNAGEAVTYELTVTNNGPSESAGPITVTDTLPLGFTFVEGSSEVTGAEGHSVNTETYVAGKQVIEWTLEGPFPAESHITLAYDVLISATAEPGAYTNTARVTGVQCSADDAEAGNCLPEPGENPETPNQDTDTITVLRSTSMNIEKEVQSLDATWGESATHVAGTEVTWRVKITNNGPSAAPVTFTEDLTFAPGVSLIAGGAALSGAGWSCNDAEHSCAYTANDGLLPVTLPDESNAAWITVKTTIAPSVEPTVAGEELVNWGRIVWQDKDSNGTETDKNDSDDAEINVVRSADLGITKRALTTDGGGVTDEVVAGESLWYSILLTNHGDSTAVGPYIVTDTLPEGITFDGLLKPSVGNWIVEQDGQELTFIRVTDAENPDESPLAVGAQLEIRFAANVANDVADEAELTNEVVIDDRTLTPNNDPTTGPEAPDAAEATVVAQRSVDVSIVKGHLDTESELGGYEVGNTITYTFDVVNDGPSVASGVTVTDTLPIGLSYVEKSVDGTDWVFVSAETNSDGREVVTARYTGTLDEGEAAPQLSFGVKVTAAIGDATTATNEVCVATAESNTATSDDRCDTDEVPIVPIADLEIKKSVVDPGSVTAGQAISWQLEVQNLGPSDSLNGTTRIRISDEVPAGVHSVTDPSVTNWTASVTRDGEPVDFPARAGDVITWTLDESIERITPTDPTDAPFVSITVNGVLDAGWTSGAVTNRAWVFEGDTRDPEPQNNDSTETVTPGDSTQVTVGKSRVVQVDGEWVIAAEQDPVPNFVPGNDITYLITAINHGPADARAVTIVDEVPAGLTYKDHESVGDGIWEHTSGGVTSAHHGGAPEGRTFSTFTLEDTQQVGAEHKRQFLVTYSTDSALQHSAADPLINWVEINAENDYDFDEDSQRDDDNAHSTRSADLGIVKTHTAPAADTSAVAGETVEYRLVVTNHGPSVSDDPITVSDRLPAEMSYVVGSARIAVDGADPVDAAPAVDGTELTWLDVTGGADLPVGAEVIITFTALIDTNASVRDPLVNFASVDGPNDNNPDNNTSRDDVELKGVADLDIRKSVANVPGTVTAGEGIDWLIEVRNLGPSSSMSVTAPISITDVVPEGVHGVADPSTTDWAATVTREGLASSFPARAGDVITWQFTGDRILANPNETADAAYTLALSGTVDAAWTQGEITNTVTIVPSDTEDPKSENNKDEATEIPGDTTQVNVGKSRVVQVDGEWVVAAEQEPVPNFVPGADISYRITVITDGPADAREVTVVDEVPAGLTYKAHVSLDTGVWAYSTGGTTSKYRDGAPEGRTFATFALEGTQQVGVDNKREFVVTYSTDPAIQHSADDPLINEVEVDAVNDRDFNEIPQRDRDNAHSTRSADLGIVKTHTAPEAGEDAIAGETVNYRLLVTNHGPSDSDEPIHVVDILPAGFSYVTDSARVSVNGAEAIAVEPAVEGNELVWTDVTDGVDLVFEATVEITFTVAIEADHDPATGIVNTAAVDGPNDNNPDNNTSNDPIDITGVANLTIGKEAITPVEEISAGEAVSWLITPRNEGPSTSLSTADAPITVTDTLPEGISRLLSDPSTSDWQATTSNAGGWEAATAGDTITFTYLGERFVVGQEPDITVTALIDPSWIGGDAITNTATIAPGETPDPELPNDDTSTIVPGDRTVIDIAKNRVVQVDGEWVLAGTLEPVPAVTPGETVSYRIDVVNHGPAIARNVTVVDPIPAGLSDPQITLLDGYGEWTGETATCEDGVTELAGYTSDECLTATLADPLGIGVANARSFIVTFATDPALDIEAELVNWAQARADNVPEDERPEDHDSTENRAIADLSIVKSATQESVLAGGTVDYELLVTNEGPSVARGPITITDTLPAGMSYVAESATVSVAGAEAVAIEPGITESATGDTLTWIVYAEGEQLAPNETIVVELQTVTAADRIAPDGLLNTASVSADDDTNPLNNEDTATVVVDPLVTLVVEKTAVSEFKVGESGRYLITVTNTGPTVDPGPITVTDSLPEGLTFESSDDDTVEADGNTVTWIIENGLQVGQTHEIELVVSIGKAAFPTVENTVVIDSPAEKTPESVLEDDEITPVLAADDLPSTGSNVALGFLIAGLLVLAGTGVLVLRDRRRPGAKAEVQA